MQLPVTEPAPLLHKKQWWNYLIANPAGYLPAHSPVEVITLDLPQTQLIGVGPAWLRGWEAVYFSLLILVSVLIKIVWRLH
jgi:hypothetical protein